MTSCKSNEDSYGFDSYYNPSWSIQTKIDNVGCWFLGYLYQEFLDGESTSTAFSNAYTLTVQFAQDRQHEMHPQQHYTLTQLLYLCL